MGRDQASAESNITWQLVRKLPSGLSFDVERHAILPCSKPLVRSSPVKPAANSSVGPSVGLPVGRRLLRRRTRTSRTSAAAMKPKAACVINARVSTGTYWWWAKKNIGHAALFLFKCWSFFLAVEQASPTGISEKIIVDLLLHTDRLTHKWPAMLMDAMKVRFAPLPTRCAHLWAAPSRPYYPGWGEAWFDRPSSAWALTSTVLGEPSSGPLLGRVGTRAELRAAPHALLASTRVPSPAHGGVRVGLLDRTDADSSEVSRRWPHAAALVEMVRREPPSDVASATAFTTTFTASAASTTCWTAPTAHLFPSLVTIIVVVAHAPESGGAFRLL